MKKTVYLAFLALAFVAGIFYGDWSARQQPTIVLMERKPNAVRLRDGAHEWSDAKSVDGRSVVIVWRQ